MWNLSPIINFAFINLYCLVSFQVLADSVWCTCFSFFHFNTFLVKMRADPSGFNSWRAYLAEVCNLENLDSKKISLLLNRWKYQEVSISPSPLFPPHVPFPSPFLSSPQPCNNQCFSHKTLTWTKWRKWWFIKLVNIPVIAIVKEK